MSAAVTVSYGPLGGATVPPHETTPSTDDCVNLLQQLAEALRDTNSAGSHSQIIAHTLPDDVPVTGSRLLTGGDGGIYFDIEDDSSSMADNEAILTALSSTGLSLQLQPNVSSDLLTSKRKSKSEKVRRLDNVIGRQGKAKHVKDAKITQNRTGTGNGSGGARRNERERNRVREVNAGFDRLRHHVPQGRRNRKLSKVDTLRAAVDYISQLQQILGHSPSTASAVEDLATLADVAVATGSPIDEFDVVLRDVNANNVGCFGDRKPYSSITSATAVPSGVDQRSIDPSTSMTMAAINGLQFQLNSQFGNVFPVQFQMNGSESDDVTMNGNTVGSLPIYYAEQNSPVLMTSAVDIAPIQYFVDAVVTAAALPTPSPSSSSSYGSSCYDHLTGNDETRSIQSGGTIKSSDNRDTGDTFINFSSWLTE